MNTNSFGGKLAGIDTSLTPQRVAHSPHRETSLSPHAHGSPHRHGHHHHSHHAEGKHSKKLLSPTQKLIARETTVLKGKRTSLPVNGSQSVIDEARVQRLVRANVVIKYGFGSNMTQIDPVQTYALVNTDKDNNDRLMYKVGSQLCSFDPDTRSQAFLQDRGAYVKDVIHYSISQNHKYVSVCESLNHEDDPLESRVAQYSIFDLRDLKRVKTVSRACERDFSMSSFCGDSKYVVTLLEKGVEKEVQLWPWEKEKGMKSLIMPESVSRVRGATVSQVMFTTSGVKHCKYHFIGGDNMIHTSNLFTASRENDYNFVEHIWLPPQGQIHKLVVLAEVAQQPGADETVVGNKKPIIFIFEGIEMQHSLASSMGISSPITLELKQTIQVKPTTSVGFRVENFTPCGKGFLIVGTFGFVAVYDRTEEKRDPYIEVKKFTLGQLHLKGTALFPSEERFVIIADSGRILSATMDASIHISTATAKETQVKSEAMEVIELDEDTPDSIATDILSGGFHQEAIVASGMAFNKSVTLTVSTDRTARLWNYETLRCELVHDFASEEPLAAAIHATGLQILVSFKDRVRLYNVAMDRLKPYQEVIQKSCKDLKFSNGCQYWAGASGIAVVVYETKSFTQLMSFQGHMMAVKHISWAPGDQVIFSAGLDGNIYGWLVGRGYSDNRLDIVTVNNRTSTIAALGVDCVSTSFARPSATSTSEQDDNAAAEAERCTLIVSSLDGLLKLPAWTIDPKKAISSQSGTSWDAPSTQVLQGSHQSAVTSVCLSADRKLLFAGTSCGSVRIYAWPPIGDAKDGVFFEVQVHFHAVIGVMLSPTETSLVTTAEDGSVFVLAVTRTFDAEHFDDTSVADKSITSVLDAEEPFKFNDDVVLVSSDEIEEHVREVTELQKQLGEIKTKNAFQVQQLQLEHRDEMKHITERHENILYDEQLKYDNLRSEFDKTIHEMTTAIDLKDSDHIKFTTELENRYEHKLSDQLDRYDLLSEEMETLKQSFEGLLQKEREEFTKKLQDLRSEANNHEKRMKFENRRLTEERMNDENSFREILNQQEEEYEDELRQLVAAAENELTSERDTVLKLRTMVQTKITKIDQMKKKLIEVSSASKARLTLLANERAEKMKLAETVEHYKKNLAEREQALSEKEKIIADLRSTTRTLENFRFVLDHRLQQLSAERGPISTHIERLERHIRTMYEELVEEFDSKILTSDSLAAKEQKLSILSKDLHAAKYEVILKERVISSFKRDLENVVAAVVVGKELEEAVNKLYKKYVKGEATHKGPAAVDDSESATLVRPNPAVKEIVEKLVHELPASAVLPADLKKSSPVKPSLEKNQKRFVREIEEALVDTAKEADRQRAFKERESNDLKHRLNLSRIESDRNARRLIFDNSNILAEYNELRKHAKTLEQQLNHTKEQLKDKEHLMTPGMPAGSQAFASGLQDTSIRSDLDTIAPLKTIEKLPAKEDDTISLSDSITSTVPIKSPTSSVANTEREASPRKAMSRYGQGVDSRPVPVILSDAAIRAQKREQIESELLKKQMKRNVPSVPDLVDVTYQLIAKKKAPKKPASDNGSVHTKTSQSSSMSALKVVSTIPQTASNVAITLPITSNEVQEKNEVNATTLKPKKANMTEARLQRMVSSLNSEIEQLSQLLDESQREKDMQRFEIAKLRKQLNEVIDGVKSRPLRDKGYELDKHEFPSFEPGHDSFVGISRDNQMISVNDALTTADRVGVPSEDDKRDLALMPVGASREENKSRISSKSHRSNNH